jgi:hypothetical protein
VVCRRDETGELELTAGSASGQLVTWVDVKEAAVLKKQEPHFIRSMIFIDPPPFFVGGGGGEASLKTRKKMWASVSSPVSNNKAE